MGMDFLLRKTQHYSSNIIHNSKGERNPHFILFKALDRFF
jgi:hypothetical protein